MITAQDMVYLTEQNTRSVEARLNEKVKDIENFIQRTAKRGERGVTDLAEADLAPALVEYFKTAGFQVEFTKSAASSVEAVGFIKISW